MCNEVDNDPWGLGYKIVTKRIGALSASGFMNEEEVRHIVDGLFPTHPEREEENDLDEDDEEAIPEFTDEELLKAVDSLQNGKAPGPDGIPTEILKIAAHGCPILVHERASSVNSGREPDWSLSIRAKRTLDCQTLGVLLDYWTQLEKATRKRSLN